MSRTSYVDVIVSDSSHGSNSESSEFRVELRKQKGSQTASADAKRYHKIPLKAQVQLFQMVFNQGKRIKQVAKTLNMNYSSAKSLIHYYKNNKRPTPCAISNILNQNKTCQFKKSNGGCNHFIVDVQIKKRSVRKYNYYHVLKRMALSTSQ